MRAACGACMLTETSRCAGGSGMRSSHVDDGIRGQRRRGGGGTRRIGSDHPDVVAVAGCGRASYNWKKSLMLASQLRSNQAQASAARARSVHKPSQASFLARLVYEPSPSHCPSHSRAARLAAQIERFPSHPCRSRWHRPPPPSAFVLPHHPHPQQCKLSNSHPYTSRSSDSHPHPSAFVLPLAHLLPPPPTSTATSTLSSGSASSLSRHPPLSPHPPLPKPPLPVTQPPHPHPCRCAAPRPPNPSPSPNQGPPYTSSPTTTLYIGELPWWMIDAEVEAELAGTPRPFLRRQAHRQVTRILPRRLPPPCHSCLGRHRAPQATCFPLHLHHHPDADFHAQASAPAQAAFSRPIQLVLSSPSVSSSPHRPPFDVCFPSPHPLVLHVLKLGSRAVMS